MSKAKTEVAPTIHGDVQYEVVECCSCENDVAKKDALGVVLYEQDRVKKRHSWVDYYEWVIYDGGYTEGWACESCADVGLVGLPSETIVMSWLSQSEMALLAFLLGGMILGVFIGVVLV